MKISVSQNCNQITFTTETPDDLYALGRIAMRLKSAYVHKPERDKRELTADMQDILSELMQVTPHDLNTFSVSSESGHEPYLVDLAWVEEEGKPPKPICGCWRSFCHGEFCKHLVATIKFEQKRLGI